MKNLHQYYFSIDGDGWADPQMTFWEPSTAFSERRGYEPIGIVHHWTGTADFTSTLKNLAARKKVSYHLLVGGEFIGQIAQLVSINDSAWHAGVSRLPPSLPYSHPARSVNRVTVGIAAVHPGWVRKDGKYSDVALWKGEDTVDTTWEGLRRDYYGWPTTLATNMYIATRSVVLSNRMDVKFVVGHDTVSPGRKYDPGPLAPYQLFANDPLRQAEVLVG